MDSIPEKPRSPPCIDTDLEKQELDDVFASPSQGGTTVVGDDFQAQGRVSCLLPLETPH